MDGWTEPVELVAEMARRDNSPVVVLKLEEIEAGQPHPFAGVIEHILPVVPSHRKVPELDIVPERGFHRGEPSADPIGFAGQVRVDHADEGVHAPLVLARDPPRHFAADTEAKHEQRNQHHHPERGQEAGAEDHGGARWTVPS
jgi:hypothetical protein